MRQRLIERFRYLWTWELVNALIVFPGLLFVMSRNVPIGVSALLATGIVCTLLVIGAAFAFIKYRDLKNGTQNIDAYERGFRVLRWIIPLWLLIVIWIIYSQPGVAETGEFFLSGALLILAVLEYINYFHVQLMYDNYNDLQYLVRNRQLKRGLIAREFDW